MKALVFIYLVFPVMDNNGTVKQQQETKSMLDWLQKSFSPSLAVVLRSGDMLVLYPHHTKTGERTFKISHIP